MSKYGRIQDYDGEKRLVDVIDIPATLPDWAEDAAAFCKKLFPDFEMVEVPDDAVSGAVVNNDGSYTAPPVVKTPEPQERKSKDQLLAQVQSLMAEIATYDDVRPTEVDHHPV